MLASRGPQAYGGSRVHTCPAQHLAWTWTKGLKDRSSPTGARSSGGVAPPPHSHLPPATLPLACAHLLTVGQHALGDPLGQVPLVQPSRWPQPWQEGHPSREAIPRCPPPPPGAQGGAECGEGKELLKTSPRTFSPTMIPAPGRAGGWDQGACCSTPDTWKQDLRQHHESVLSQSADEL